MRVPLIFQLRLLHSHSCLPAQHNIATQILQTRKAQTTVNPDFCFKRLVVYPCVFPVCVWCLGVSWAMALEDGWTAGRHGHGGMNGSPFPLWSPWPRRRKLLLDSSSLWRFRCLKLCGFIAFAVLLFRYWMNEFLDFNQSMLIGLVCVVLALIWIAIIRMRLAYFCMFV